ncbi:hypothetical protein RMCBS344292_19067 [Rhizopus microsporus]|nr:hypothetical protein RMCBS344292_19067 [Rhizopus microsporus]
MGANTSKSAGKNKATTAYHQKFEDLVDLGAVFPNGLYPATEQDYDPRIVKSLIIARKIAPFYKGLPDAPEPKTETTDTLSPLSSLSEPEHNNNNNNNISGTVMNRSRSASSSSRARYDPYVERQKAYMEKMKQREKILYNDAVECPICFLVIRQEQCTIIVLNITLVLSIQHQLFSLL